MADQLLSLDDLAVHFMVGSALSGGVKTLKAVDGVTLDVKAGDLILFGKYSGQEIKLDGEEYLIMREDEVLAVIEDGDTKKKK